MSILDINHHIGLSTTPTVQQVYLRASSCGCCCAFGLSENEMLAKLCEAFGCGPDQENLLTFQQFGPVVRACRLGHFWRRPLFDLGLNKKTPPTRSRDRTACDELILSSSSVFMSRWLGLKRKHDSSCEIHRCVDPVALFVAVVGRGDKDKLSVDDLISWVEDVADCALDLTDSYLREPYVDTVLARLLLRYGVRLSGILTATSLKMCGFGRLLDRLCRCTGLIPRIRRSGDVNMVLACSDEELDLPDEFSYDDFLAIFGLYWELTARQRSLDSIPLLDLFEYTPLSKRFLCEIFKVACVRPFSISEGSISYPDFVWLIVSAEGKGCWPQSAEYLFRVLDLESDGVLTPDELHYFYQEYLGHKNRNHRSFQDVMCEIVDAIRPDDPTKFTLLDIRRSGLAHVFFSPFVDAPDSHHHHAWSVQKRRSCHASWWPTGCFPDPGFWECFVQDRLEHMRCSEQLQGTPNKDSNRNSRQKLSRKQGRTRNRKSRNKNL